MQSWAAAHKTQSELLALQSFTDPEKNPQKPYIFTRKARSAGIISLEVILAMQFTWSDNVFLSRELESNIHWLH